MRAYDAHGAWIYFFVPFYGCRWSKIIPGAKGCERLHKSSRFVRHGSECVEEREPDFNPSQEKNGTKIIGH
jgi:hypothetical protein